MKGKAIANTNLSPLVQVADYLSRPQQFLAVAEARAGFREALQASTTRSVILTNNGAPQAALVPFETLEAMRSALLQLLVGEMNHSFVRLQNEVASDNAATAEPTSEEELERLVKEARRQPKKGKRSA
jgi:prevent-host-death family protein